MSGSCAPPGLIGGAVRVFLLACRTQTYSKRMALPVLVMAIMPVIAWISPSTGLITPGAAPVAVQVFHQVCAKLLIKTILWVIVLFMATAALGEEFENRTIIHMLTRPVRRSSVYLGKLCWVIGISWICVAVSTVVTFMIVTTRIGGEFGAGYLLGFLLVELVAVIVYSMLFFLFSLVLPFPTIIGLAYGFMEAGVASMPGYFSRAAVQTYILFLWDQAGIYEDLPALVEVNKTLLGQEMQNTLTTEQAVYVLGGACAVLLVAGLVVMSFREFSGRLGKDS